MKYFWHILIGGNIQLSTIWLCADERKSRSVTQWWKWATATGYICLKPHTVFSKERLSWSLPPPRQRRLIKQQCFKPRSLRNLFIWSADGDPTWTEASRVSMLLIKHTFINHIPGPTSVYSSPGTWNTVKVQELLKLITFNRICHLCAQDAREHFRVSACH